MSLLPPTEQKQRPLTHVAAAVILRPAANKGATGTWEYLLAQRPPGKPYAGYWEFPGGKQETGESIKEACQRELHEELGIETSELLPWITRQFDYPHALVRLKFFKINAWRGVITPHEHTGIVWQTLGADPTVHPILPANGPILRALALPTSYCITCATENGIETELERAAQAFAAGVRLFQVRDKELPPEPRARLAQQLIRLARPSGAKVLINTDIDLAQSLGADGIHLPAPLLMSQKTRPDVPWVGASCHRPEELIQAAAINVDFVVLGSVLPTPTHPNTTPLGWEHFAQLIIDAPMPVFALGGIRPGMLDLAQQNNAHGVALMRNWPS